MIVSVMALDHYSRAIALILITIRTTDPQTMRNSTSEPEYIHRSSHVWRYVICSCLSFGWCHHNNFIRYAYLHRLNRRMIESKSKSQSMEGKPKGWLWLQAVSSKFLTRNLRIVVVLITWLARFSFIERDRVSISLAWRVDGMSQWD